MELTDYKFYFDVGASIKIANVCPGKDLAKLGDVFNAPYGEMMPVLVKIMVALSEGGARHYHTPVLTEDEIFCLSTEGVKDLINSVMSAISSGAETEIKTKKAEAVPQE